MEGYELARRAAERDPDAFLGLMELHKAALYRTAFAFLKDEHAAVEAVQEVTARAFRSIHRLRNPEYAKTWLTRIMINYCQDELKRKGREPATDRLPDVDGSDRHVRLELDEALESLPDPSRRLIHLKYFEDLKIREIAEMEQIPEGTVKSRLHHSLRQLREFFAGKGGSADV
ncbi:sigma-70 family RNA polymerase sigma factor [Bhargavaea cecembensis]|uniref:sigma-70 family RNA polymerase sigma factor n=1 Tax=Bhargavaea cecembensis TaxID=394098 RepID=UPI00058B0C67|nr:sigma-70 family RNA polymerase sigma factor [Bhargavaea cecembensis]